MVSIAINTLPRIQIGDVADDLVKREKETVSSFLGCETISTLGTRHKEIIVFALGGNEQFLRRWGPSALAGRRA
jgi:hypothetical protein